MKTFIAGVVLGMGLSCGVVFASPGFLHNGLFWHQLSNPAKNGYIDGYRDAMEVSVQEVNTLSIAATYLHWKHGDKIIHQLAQELSLAGITPDDAVRKLDALYANPKYGELDLGQALQLLSAEALQNSASSRAVTSKSTVAK